LPTKAPTNAAIDREVSNETHRRPCHRFADPGSVGRGTGDLRGFGSCEHQFQRREPTAPYAMDALLTAIAKAREWIDDLFE
jgi:hypothetical protein